MIDNTGYLYPGLEFMGQSEPADKSSPEWQAWAEKMRAAAASAGRAAAAASQAASERGKAQEQAQAAAMQTASQAAAVRAGVPAPVPFFRSPAFVWTAAALGGVVILTLALKPAAPKTYFVRR